MNIYTRNIVLNHAFFKKIMRMIVTNNEIKLEKIYQKTIQFLQEIKFENFHKANDPSAKMIIHIIILSSPLAVNFLIIYIAIKDKININKLNIITKRLSFYGTYYI